MCRTDTDIQYNIIQYVYTEVQIYSIIYYSMYIQKYRYTV